MIIAQNVAVMNQIHSQQSQTDWTAALHFFCRLLNGSYRSIWYVHNETEQL